MYERVLEYTLKTLPARRRSAEGRLRDERDTFLAAQLVQLFAGIGFSTTTFCRQRVPDFLRNRPSTHRHCRDLLDDVPLNMHDVDMTGKDSRHAARQLERRAITGGAGQRYQDTFHLFLLSSVSADGKSGRHNPNGYVSGVPSDGSFARGVMALVVSNQTYASNCSLRTAWK